MTHYSGLYIIILLLAVIGCSQEAETTTSPDGVDFDLNLELVLESEELAFPGHPILTTITAVRAYGESGFLAADNHNKQILQLDRDGNVIQRTGQEGRGPGEFAGLNNVIPLRDGRFGVPDLNNARNIIFDAEGNAVMHNDKQPEDPYLTAKVYLLDNGGYITPSYRKLYEGYDDCIFVELDQDLQTLDPCYGSYDALNESDNSFLREDGQNSAFGDIHFVGENRFMFIRRNYDGTHYFYERTNDDWIIDSTATGYVEVPASVTNYSGERRPNVVTRSFSGRPSISVMIHNQSMGYEVYDDRYLLHFTATDQGGDERIPGVELWTTDGTYLGYKPLDYLQEQYDGLKQGGLREALRIRAFNDGRLVLAAPQAFYIFDVALTFSG